MQAVQKRLRDGYLPREALTGLQMVPDFFDNLGSPIIEPTARVRET